MILFFLPPFFVGFSLRLTVDALTTAVFTVEVLMRIYGESARYLKSWLNVFELTMTVLNYTEFFVTDLTYIRVNISDP